MSTESPPTLETAECEKLLDALLCKDGTPKKCTGESATIPLPCVCSMQACEFASSCRESRSAEQTPHQLSLAHD